MKRKFDAFDKGGFSSQLEMWENELIDYEATRGTAELRDLIKDLEDIDRQLWELDHPGEDVPDEVRKALSIYGVPESCRTCKHQECWDCKELNDGIDNDLDNIKDSECDEDGNEKHS